MRRASARVNTVKMPKVAVSTTNPAVAVLDRETHDTSAAERGRTLRHDLRQLRRLLRYIRPYRFRLYLGLLAGAAFGALSGAFIKAVQVVFKSLFESSQRPSLKMMVTTALAIPLYFGLRGIMSFLNTYLLSWVGSRVLRDIRVELFNHMQGLSLDFFIRNPVGQLIQRVSNNTATMQRSLLEVAEDVVKQPITVLTALGVLVAMNPWLFLLGVVLTGLCVFPITYFGRKVRRSSQADQRSSGQLIGVLHEAFSNIRVIKAYLLEHLHETKFVHTANRQMSNSLRIIRQRETMAPMIEIIASLGIVGVLVYACQNRVPIATFTAMVLGFYIMYEPLKKLGRINVQFQRALAACDKVFDILDSLPSIPEPEDGIALKSFNRAIEFQNVSLRYERGRPALRQINLTIPCGSVCALVGPSGAGKTSLINLLMRFYDPTRGRVLIDGNDLRAVETASLRRLIGLVTQETILFADTVANNIGFGRPGATREEIMEAARRGNAHEFIMAMPKQYDTVLADRGQNLSGGQRQRITIARAILKDAAILILDEATNALDAHSEEQVQKGMAELMAGRTVIIIAHRLSTVRQATQIVVLDEGEITETGSHQSLLAQNGLYSRLYELQTLPG